MLVFVPHLVTFRQPTMTALSQAEREALKELAYRKRHSMSKTLRLALYESCQVAGIPIGEAHDDDD